LGYAQVLHHITPKVSESDAPQFVGGCPSVMELEPVSYVPVASVDNLAELCKESNAR
jgi:hypothetical protein